MESISAPAPARLDPKENPAPSRQVGEPCPGVLTDGSPCGSYFRRGDFCNKCGTFAPYKEPEQKAFSFNKPTVGRIWSKAKHRYLTEEEIKRGEKGG